MKFIHLLHIFCKMRIYERQLREGDVNKLQKLVYDFSQNSSL